MNFYIKALVEAEVTYQVTWEPETDFAPDFDDPTVQEWVERRMNRGHVEAWCCITVTAAWECPRNKQTYTAFASLGGCSLDGANLPDSAMHQLIEKHARDSDLYTEALTNLNERLRSHLEEAKALLDALQDDSRADVLTAAAIKDWEERSGKKWLGGGPAPRECPEHGMLCADAYCAARDGKPERP